MRRRVTLIATGLCLGLVACGGDEWNTAEQAEAIQRDVTERRGGELSNVDCSRDGPKENATFLCNSMFADSGEEFRSRVVLKEDGSGISSEP